MAPPFSKPYIESSPKRVRVFFGGKFIVDTTDAKLVWEHPYYPNFFFPHTALAEEHLRPSDSKSGTYDLAVSGKLAPGAVQKYDTSDDELGGLLKIKFDAMDAWFEEEEQIFVHPKDPYKRVDVQQSSKHVRVEAQGVTLAETRMPRLLFETSLRVRTYIPKTDCRFDLFVPSDTTSQCPYKGVANYYDVRLPSGETLKDVVWWYRAPQPECDAIKGFAAFYDEKLDIWVDGQKQPK